MSQRVGVTADGGSRGNPGPAGYGAVVTDLDTGAVLAERSGYLGTATNNVAEYRGLIAGLAAAAELGARTVAVRMDSKLVVEQMSGRWQVKNDALRELAGQAQALRRGFAEVTFSWIPRAQNKHADRLANEAMDRGTGKGAGPATAGPASAPAAPVASAPGTGWSDEQRPPTRLVLVRHGASAHSARRLLSGVNDLPLAPVGRAQADALARRFAAGQAQDPIAAIVSSPLPRARQTAERIAAELGLAVEFDERLGEVDFGAWEGLSFTEARERYPAEFAAWRESASARPPDGESFAELARRVRRGRDALITAHPGVSTVVVSHVSPIKTLIRLGLGAPEEAMFRLHLDTASVSIIDYAVDGSALVRLVNDSAHLAAVG